MCLTQATGRQLTSLREGSIWHVGPSGPLRRESPTTITHLFFLVEVFVIQGVDLSDLGNTSDLDIPSSTSSIDWHSTSRATYLLYRGTWEGEVGMEGVHLLPWAWAFPHSLLSFKPLPSTWQGEDTGSSWSCFFLVAVPVSVSGRAV